VTSVAGQAIEVRGLIADVDTRADVDHTVCSLVIAAWTGPGYSNATDLDLSGNTDSIDRSIVIAEWTSLVACAS